VAAVKAEGFQLWRLTVKDSAATLNCEDGNGRAVFAKAIPLYRLARRGGHALFLQQHHPFASLSEY
jgi:hypothetical protein